MKSISSYKLVVSFSIFLITTSIYFLLSPGRIDQADSLVRLEGTKGVIETGFPVIDPALKGMSNVIKSGVGEYDYASGYGVSPHFLYVPFVGLIKSFSEEMDFEQFWFSHINHVFAGATIVLLFLFYLSLNLGIRDAVIWAFACAFFTQFFVTATSSFYQVFQGFFLLLSVFFAFYAGKNQSFAYVLLSGISFFIFIMIKASFIVFAPAIALLLLEVQDGKLLVSKRAVYQIILFAVLCIAALICWDYYRSFYVPSVLESPLAVTQAVSSVKSAVGGGNVLTGLFILLFSPGKGMLFYSPIFFVAVFGVRYLFTFHKLLTISICYIIVVWFLGVAQTPYPSGDWCWGPRYIVPIAAVMFLFVPFGYKKLFAKKKGYGKLLLGYCLLVQLLGLSLDFNQFFYRHGLTAYFWKDQSFYYSNSQLVERPIDILESIHHFKKIDFSGDFRPGSFPESLTYPIGGAYHPDRRIVMSWMKEYPVFWVPRPWPIWMQFLDPGRLPIKVGLTMLFGFSTLMMGLIMLYMALSKNRREVEEKNTAL